MRCGKPPDRVKCEATVRRIPPGERPQPACETWDRQPAAAGQCSAVVTYTTRLNPLWIFAAAALLGLGGLL